MPDNFAVRQGTALGLRVQLQDALGQPVAGYTGTEALSATVWPGGNRSSSFAASVAWVSGPAGTISLNVSASQTAGLAPGRWSGIVDLVDPSAGPVEAYRWTMDVLQAPGSAPAPPAYCWFPDLLNHARSWLRKLQADDDDEGFSGACGRARAWLDDLIIARSPALNYTMLGDPGYGSTAWVGGGSLAPNQWLRATLDGGGLVLRDWVVEATAKRALCFICEGQLGPGESGKDYRVLGWRFKTESYNLACAHTAEILTPGQAAGSNPNFFVPLGSGSVRGYG